jgi:DNA-binding GntR family transcriptional regulator
MTLNITRTVKSSLADNLREDILRGEIVPGQNIRLEEIAARFDPYIELAIGEVE